MKLWITACALWLTVSVSAQTPAQTSAQSELITFAAYKDAYLPSDAVLLDRYGEAIASKRLDASARRLAWVSLSDVSPAFLEALLVAEDKRFYAHSGVDWLGAAAALWDNLGKDKTQKTRGASSISMQMAALLDAALVRQKTGRSWGQKWDQMQAAQTLERRWSKPDILEAYFNSITYRGELQGLSAAAQGLFQKAPSGLDKSESALLAALIRAPNAKAAALIERACVILRQTRQGTACDKAAFGFALDAATLKPQVVSNIAPHAAQHLLTRSQTVRSTLDAHWQRVAKSALNQQIEQLQAQGAEDGAVVVLDNQSGDVLAYVGSSGAWSGAAQVDAAQANRQAGSTLKPFLYALALESKRLTAATLLDDSAVALPTDVGLYVPQNYDRQFMGPVSVRTALAASLNIPAVRTLALLPEGQFYERLKRLGISSLHSDPAHYGLSLALGSADVKLIELTNAYRSLANGGLYSAWHWQAALEANPRAASSRRVFSQDAAWLVSNILSDNTARSHTFGFDSVLATPIWTSVKTGTSKDMRDNWCIGYSERYTVGVWIGNASGAPMRNVSGVSGAAPAWDSIMRALHANERSRPPRTPSSIQSRTIRFQNGIEPGRTEWFLAGTAPPNANHEVLLAPNDSSQHTRILYPVNGSLMAWDPDIPAVMQGIVLKHSGDEQELRWIVNNQPHPARELLWARDAIKGKTKIELLTKEGVVVDEVVFELRGVSQSR